MSRSFCCARGANLLLGNCVMSCLHSCSARRACMGSRSARHLAAAFALLPLASPAFTGLAQTAQPKPELLLNHPAAPLAYEVATIKPVDANAANDMVSPPPGVDRLD